MKRATNKSSKDLNKSSVNVAGEFQTERESDRFFHAKLKVFEEIETDQESSGSSEDMESPRSVSKVRKWPVNNLSVRVHSQILKIREEDSHLGEDVVGEYCLISARDNVAGHGDVAVVLFSRPTLPASPLGGKAAIKLVH